MSVPWPFVTFRFYRIWLIEQMGGQNGWILTRFFICMFYARRCSPSRNTELHIKGSLVTAMKTVTYVLYFHLRLLLAEQIKAVSAYCSVICYKLFFFWGKKATLSLCYHTFLGTWVSTDTSYSFLCFYKSLEAMEMFQCFLIYVKWINFSLVCNI